MFVWLFHRVSGLALIVLLGMQMVTGLTQLSKDNPDSAEASRRLHVNGFCTALLVLLLTMHALYGLRALLYDLGVRREKALFWGCTGCGLVLSGVYLWFFFSMA